MIFDNTGRPKIPRNKWAFQTGVGGSSGSTITISYNGNNNDYVDSRYVTQAQFENFTNHIEDSFYNGKTYYDDSTNTIVFDSSFTVLRDTSLSSLWVTNDSSLWGKTFINNIDVSSGHIRYVNVDDISINKEYVRTSNVDNAYIQEASIQEANVNNLTVYGSAHFFNLTIDEVKAAGGQLILSAADFKIDKVGFGVSRQVLPLLTMNGKYSTTGFFDCVRVYQKAEDEDGKKILNKWRPGDLCLCQTFNLTESGTYSEIDNKLYWKLIYGVGTEDGYNYLDIAWIYTNTDKQEEVGVGTFNPEVGDELVLLGSCTTSDRQHAIVISAYKSPDMTVKAPSIVQYKGINDFNFTNKIYNKMSANGNTFRGDLYVESGDSIDTYISGKITSEVEVDTTFWKMIPNKAIAIVSKNDTFVIDLEYAVYKQDGDHTTIQTISTTSDGKEISVKYYTDINPSRIELKKPKSVYIAKATVSNYHKQLSRAKHVYVELMIGGNVIQRDTLDVVFDAGAVLDISDTINARVQNVEGQLAEINVDPDQIKAAVYDELNGDLRETGIDIATGKITLKADNTEIEGNRLYLWDDDAGFVIGDTNKKDVRIQVLNNSLPYFPEFGGRLYSNHGDQLTPYNYAAGYEFWTDYMELGNYIANTEIVTENAVRPYVTYTFTYPSGGGGGSNSDSYNRSFVVTRYIYKVTGTEADPVYTLKYTSDAINTSTSSSDFHLDTKISEFKQKVTEAGHYVVRFKIKCNEAANKTDDGRQLRANFHIFFYYNKTDILSKSIISKDGVGIIKNAYNRLFYGYDGESPTSSRFDVKVGYIGYAEDSDFCQRIDMTCTHINLNGNVNILKKYHDYNDPEYYGNKVYINEISLDDYDIVTISSGEYNQLKWLNESPTTHGSVCGRTKRIYVNYSTTITAPRGTTKFRCYTGGAPFTLRQAWLDGTDYNNSGNTGSFLKVSVGQVYDVTMINGNLYTIVKVV